MGVQVAGDTVMSSVFHKPPSIPPTQTVLPVGSPISSQIARTRPEVLPFPGLPLPLLVPTASLFGPRSSQTSDERLLAVADLPAILSWRLRPYASTSLPLGTYP